MRKDWISKTLKELFKIETGNTPSKKEINNYGSFIPFIKPPEISNKTIGTAKEYLSEIGSKKGRIALKNSVLITCIGNLGRVGINKEMVSFNQQINAILDNKIIEPKFTFYQAQSLEFKMQLDKLSTATTVALVNKRNFETIDFKLAPLLEQKAIVSKIEQLFSELDNGIENLKIAQTKLKIYRQAVLKKAFEGELTKEWREKQSNLPTASELLEEIKKEREEHYIKQVEKWKLAILKWEENDKESKRPSRISKPKFLPDVKNDDIKAYDNLPKDWKWTRFSDVTYKIGDIDHKMPKDFAGGLPYLSTGNIKKDGSIDFKNAKTISQEDFNRLSLKIKPENGDIIFPRYGTIGRNILINFDREFLVSYSCAIIKNITILMDNKFVYYYSLSPVIKKEIKRYVVQTTQANIGIASIESFVFPLCSTLEQTQVVQEIESRLSVCDNIETTLTDALQKSEALRQSILKKAFEGKLLTEKELEDIKNNPEYESAEKLLERIKQERDK